MGMKTLRCGERKEKKPIFEVEMEVPAVLLCH